jgi:UDP-glucose 4-epimerase
MNALCGRSDVLASADIVCHLASETVPSSSQADPAIDVRTNLLPAIECLEAMREQEVRRVLFLSSGGAVYGIPRETPISEDHPTDPISPYGVIKLAIEKFLGSYAANHGFRPAIVRAASAYGIGQGKVGQLGPISTFINTIRERGTATLYGDGSIVRDFVHVDDLCRLMLACVEQQAVGVFNCGGGGRGTSLSELVALIEEITGETLALTQGPARSFDPPATVLDIARARAQLSWEPQVSLRAGVEQLLSAGEPPA